MVNSQAEQSLCAFRQKVTRRLSVQSQQGYPCPQMTSTKKVTYKQIKASPTKLDAILHLVKIKGKVSTLTLSADTGTTVPQAGTNPALAPNVYLRQQRGNHKSPGSQEELLLLPQPRKSCPDFLSVCHSATKVIGFSTDRLFLFQEPRGKGPGPTRPPVHP